MRFADGVIFLTEYAAKVIQETTGKLHRTAVIPHGVGNEFTRERSPGGVAGRPAGRSAAFTSPTPPCTSISGSS